MRDQDRDNLKIAKTFLRAVESMDDSVLDELFDSRVEQIEWPNLFKPQGDRRNLDQMKSGIAQAKAILSGQSYEISREMSVDECVVLELVWRGTSKIEHPPLTVGQELQAHCVAVFDFADGRIVALRNYDCFDSLS